MARRRTRRTPARAAGFPTRPCEGQSNLNPQTLFDVRSILAPTRGV